MSTISDIKERIDIVALLSEYVQLSKAGKNFKGLCPFHAEKHASFFVFPDRQTWRCFGSCGEGGDIFSFIMKKENLEFREALELLATRAGVQIKKQDRPMSHMMRLANGCLRQLMPQRNTSAACYWTPTPRSTLATISASEISIYRERLQLPSDSATARRHGTICETSCAQEAIPKRNSLTRGF